MGRVETKNCKKLLIECIPNNEEVTIKILSNVFIVRIFLNYNEFINLPDLEKKKVTLNLIVKYINFLAINENINSSFVEDTYNEIEKANYINEWNAIKNVKSPNKLYSSDLLLRHEIDEVIINIVIKDNNGKIVKKEILLTDLPDEYRYSKHLGKLIWLNNKQVQLINLREDKTWIVSV